MSDNNKDDPNDFNDDFGVEEDFSDISFDEPGFEEEADFSEDVDGDLEYTDEDFAEEEWQEDDLGSMAADPSNEKLYRGGKEKKSLLSFNAMVIIGALVVGGGVLVFTVMNKSQEAASAKGNIFRSMLNISEIMDGGLFGGKEEEPAPDVATPTDAPSDGGFLNNPDQLAAPPQPSPIASPETQEQVAEGEPLTPMPEDTQVPRGPDEVATPVDVDATAPDGTDTAIIVPDSEQNKAEVLLQEAIANREAEVQTQPEEQTPAEISAPSEDTPMPVPAEAVAEPAPPTPAEAPAVPDTEQTATETTSVPVVDEAAQQELQTLKTELEQASSRIESLESELAAQKSGEEVSTQTIEELQSTIQSLQAELKELKNRPAPVAEKVETTKPKTASAKKKTSTAKKTSSSDAPYKAPSSSGTWELRAAQPGRAWVSRPGERDMRSIEVGDTLPGIGQVTGIHYHTGRWTVQGTQGQIVQ